MKLIYDEVKIEEGIEAKVYDDRNLSKSKSGKYHYPSKLMFIQFLKKFRDVDGEAQIWSTEFWDKGEVRIHVEIKYKVKELEGKANPVQSK